ncbi:MAG: hypothetical protein GC159_15130 [Phycisphaera sp.]|nr:hypothetical protein [Phycisphaera sp.]
MHPTLKGTLYAAVGALVGAMIWYTVARATQYEVGWIAWIVGAVIGLGMAMGAGDKRSLREGMIAIALAIASIMFAKYLIYRAISGPEITDEEIVVQILAAETIRSHGRDPAKAPDAVWIRELGAAQEKVKVMPPEQVAGIADAARDEYFTAGRAWSNFMRAMLGSPINGLFFFLACGSAFRIGAGSGEDT